MSIPTGLRLQMNLPETTLNPLGMLHYKVITIKTLYMMKVTFDP